MILHLLWAIWSPRDLLLATAVDRCGSGSHQAKEHGSQDILDKGCHGSVTRGAGVLRACSTV